MPSRVVINVASTPHTRKGQDRLKAKLDEMGEELVRFRSLPLGWPSHEAVPFAFKAHALHVVELQYDTLLWCDASILPVRSLEPVWEKIERDGYLLMNNGFANATWTADSAYPDLFGVDRELWGGGGEDSVRETNRSIPHTVGGFFGLSMKHDNGRAFLAELYRLASETKAFCGPWWNSNNPEYADKPGAARCGPPDVKGHRHDQSAMSVIAWRLGMKLSDCPDYFVYGKAEQATDPRTCVVADGDY